VIWPIEYAGIIDSTMRLAQERAMAGASSGTTIVAEGQTQGRGRRGRTWFSQPGTGLWFTTILRPPPTHTEISTLSLIVGIAIQKALTELGAQDIGLKWPNDLWAKGRKLGGILLESHFTGENLVVLVGVGINLAPLSPESLPAEIAQRYIGLADLVSNISRDKTLEITLHHIKTCYDQWRTQGFAPFVQEWKMHDVLTGREIRAELDGRGIIGVSGGIQADGALKLMTATGVQNIYSGEVEKVEGTP